MAKSIKRKIDECLIFYVENQLPPRSPRPDYLFGLCLDSVILYPRDPGVD